jgi:hypothetical protein
MAQWREMDAIATRHVRVMAERQEVLSDGLRLRLPATYHCDWCRHDWPCDSRKLLDILGYE